MQHTDAEVPEAQAAVLADTAEAVVAVIATPWVEGDRGDPRAVALAPGYKDGAWDVPDGDEVVLPARKYVLTVWGPADADEPAIVGVEVVDEPVWVKREG